MTTRPKSALIESESGLQEFLPVLSQSSGLYFDIEGFNLSRHGTIAIISILAHPSNQVQLIDVSTLGALAFSTASEDGKTLRSILEDHSIRKYIWDVRNDADALWFHYGVSLGGITDLQLLENASRPDDKTYVRGLDKCVQYDLKLGFMETNRWLQTKQDTRKLMHTYTNLFSIRPMDPKTAEYCQNDLVYLPALREMYMARIKPEWLAKAEKESAHRVAQAQSAEYDPQSERKKLGPWGSGGNKRILTFEQMCEMEEEAREEAIERDMFGYDDDLGNLDDDLGWD
ncbi:ribonuclease H-like domain-containing protein [Boeremia exigua]|uniref:ribonuclease H-like domain-containing protein n=1 Tax=Boeremia exigua TaxID=749465 RepID=UPI001E8ECA8D|nr:ribonuclease H-like domain-containing protein [Boeremia exigua]KAH6629773.1 ribonuclease H-like domain-containing protein [Boeremia exigua]